MATAHTEPIDYEKVPQLPDLHALNIASAGTSLTKSNSTIIYLPAFGGDAQPGLHRPLRKFANPAPLGLCAFALNCFVLSIINAGSRGVTTPNIIVGLAYAYGGLVQLLAGMWEMACGNTFAATAFSSYGGFWISFGMIQTGGFGIEAAYSSTAELYNALAFYVLGWFIFTFIMTLCTVKSTLPFFLMFLFVDLVFILLVASYMRAAEGHDSTHLTKAAGICGLIAGFLAWWNAFAGLADKSNSFFTLPALHFPWSAKPEDFKKKDIKQV